MTANPPAKLANSSPLRFGTDCAWSLPDGDTVACITRPVLAVDDLSQAIVAALESPLGLPSLDQVMVPGDIVALAIDPLLPGIEEVVGRVALWLCEKGTEPANLKIVVAARDPQFAIDIKQGLARSFNRSQLDPNAISVELHDADDANQVSYVAANEDSDPIYVNRTLVDADIVLPLSCARHHDTLGYLGVYGIFPLLSNRQTQGEFHRLSRLDDPPANAKLKRWADEAAWWLGLMAAIQVVPAAEDSVAAVVAGLIENLEETSQALFTRLWQTDCVPSDLVIALLDGRQTQQTWREVARALRAATQYANPGGSIVVCTQLRESVGKSLRRLSDSHHSRDSIAKKLSQERTDDALPAAVVLEATRDYHVYLTSELSRGSVENLGLGVIETEDQLSHLVSQHATCTVLGSAQHRFWTQ